MESRSVCPGISAPNRPPCAQRSVVEAGMPRLLTCFTSGSVILCHSFPVSLSHTHSLSCLICLTFSVFLIVMNMVSFLGGTN